MLETVTAGADANIALGAISAGIAYFSQKNAVQAARQRFEKAKENYENIQFQITDIEKWKKETVQNIQTIKDQMEERGNPIE